MRLSASIRSVDAIDVVALFGEIDFGTSDRFAAALATLVYDRLGGVLVDLRRVGFMDSTGIHPLPGTPRRPPRPRRQLAVVCAPGPVYDVLETAGLLAELSVHETRTGAE